MTSAAGHLCAVAEQRVVRRTVRRQASGAGGSVNVAADANVVVSGSGSASSQHDVRIVQRGGASAGNETSGDAAHTKEDR